MLCCMCVNEETEEKTDANCCDDGDKSVKQPLQDSSIVETIAPIIIELSLHRWAPKGSLHVLVHHHKREQGGR